MEYVKTEWKDLPDTTTPITASALNNIEDGVEYLFENGTGGGDNLPVGVEMDFDGASQDIPTGWESVTNPDSYSTSEVKTNKVWIDNKPIYRKVFNRGTSLESFAHNISNVSDIWVVNDMTFRKHTSTNTIPLNGGSNTSALKTSCYVNTTTVTIETFDSVSPEKVYVTLEYTKTTD